MTGPVTGAMTQGSASPLRMLITGGSGDLGHVLVRQASAAGHQVCATYFTRPERLPPAAVRRQVDLRDADAVQRLIDESQPEVIVHTAMQMGDDLHASLVVPAQHLSRYTPRGTRLILLSTDMVFDGSHAPYTETSVCAPTTPYGHAKAEMERCADHVIRTSLIYDFVRGNKQVEWMVAKLDAGERVKLFTDEIRSAVWVQDLALAVLSLAVVPWHGILHAAGPVGISRYDLGVGLLRELGYDPAQVVEAGSLVGSGRTTPDLTMDVTTATMLLNVPFLTFDQARQQWRAMQ